MRVTFVLPSRSPVPIGAYRTVYELANHLVARGDEVAVVHPRTVVATGGPAGVAKDLLWVRRYRHRPAELAPWFQLDPRVRLLAVADLSKPRLPDADALVAVTWEAAPAVAAAPATKGVGCYFIQEGVPEPVATPRKVEAAWALPLHKIVIAGWLEDKARERGEGATTSRAPIGVDLDRWGVDVPVAGRPPRVAAMLNPIKGQADVIEALTLARASVPDLGAACYGTGERPATLPAWTGYERLPDREALRRLYNSASIFLQASREEGWGLPPNEAAACGCAVVTYDTGGSREYADDRETALVVDPPSPAGLATAIAELCGDDALRVRLAESAAALVAGLTWERATEAFRAALTRAVESPSAAAAASR
jgi:glycosyltransferase involved in cell wall biosynthesis